MSCAVFTRARAARVSLVAGKRRARFFCAAGCAFDAQLAGRPPAGAPPIVRKRRAAPRAARRAGHSLIEILAALAVVGVALVGATGLGLFNERQTQALVARNLAAALLDDIARKIDQGASPPARYRTTFGAPPGGCAAPDCAAAARHLHHWKCRLGRWSAQPACAGAGLLPDGDGEIVAAGASELLLRVRWRDGGELRTLTLYHAPPHASLHAQP